MAIMDNIKAAAANIFMPASPKRKNPAKPDPVYGDLNRDGIDTPLEPKRKVDTNIIKQPTSRYGPVEPPRDRHGHYVQTMSYPLPPVGWEKKQFAKNRRLRNSKNNYL